MGKEAKLAFMGHALMENRNALLVGFQTSLASGTAERQIALQLLDEQLEGERRITLGADRGFDYLSFVEALRDRNVVPHVAQSEHRTPATDARTTRHTGYAISIGARRQADAVHREDVQRQTPEGRFRAVEELREQTFALYGRAVGGLERVLVVVDRPAAGRLEDLVDLEVLRSFGGSTRPRSLKRTPIRKTAKR